MKEWSGWHVAIEQDGPRFRWVLLWGKQRMAKGTRWWHSEDAAQMDYDNFAEAARSAPVARNWHKGAQGQIDDPPPEGGETSNEEER